jgi:ribonuclease-3 family protein
VLAFLGDAVFELMVRARLVGQGNAPIGQLHRRTVAHVSAAAQSAAFPALEPLLTEEELAIFKRGRNTHNNTPKNADPAQYRCATGLEALFGYLYLLGRQERAQALFDALWEAAAEG